MGERRSLVGTAAMGLASLSVLLALALLGPAPAAPPAAGIALIAVLATVLEQWAVLGIDNLTVPLTVAGLWQLLA